MSAGAQIIQNGPGTWVWTNTAPAYNPGRSGSKIAIDTTTMDVWQYKSGTTWVKRGRGVDQITGCTKPAYTPTKFDATVAISLTCDSIWRYRSGAWYCMNCVSAGDDWGGQTVVADLPLKGDGTDADPLRIDQQGATSGQVLGWNGSAWVPKTDENTGTTYSAGTGIGIVGTTISNTGDLSATNEIQTLSTGTNTLTLSGGGGTVTVDTDPTNDVTGSGTATRLAYWSGTSVLTSTANLLWDNTNTRLSIGAGASPSDALHVNGPIRATNLGLGQSPTSYYGTTVRLGINAVGSGSTQPLFRGYTFSGSTRFAFDISSDDRGVITAYGVGGSNPIVLSANSTSYLDGSATLTVGTSTPSASAKFQVESTTSGVLLPRMTTTQRDAIGSPADGLMIYNTSISKFQGRAGGAWVDLH